VLSVRRGPGLDPLAAVGYLTRHSTGVFVAYRVLMGLLLIGLLAGGAINAT